MQDGQQHGSLYSPAGTTSSLGMMQHPEGQQLFLCDVPTATAPSQESRESHRDWKLVFSPAANQQSGPGH